MNYVEKRVNEIKNEILDLKTACKYTSTRNVNVVKIQNVHTGLYQVVFEKDGFITSYFPGYIPNYYDAWGNCYERTPNQNIQIIEVDSTMMGDDPDGPRVDNYITLTIVSSVKILSVTRIS